MSPPRSIPPPVTTPNPTRGTPGVGSTHYIVAYTCIHGQYPSLTPRMMEGERTTGEDPAVMELLQRVHIVGQQDRPAFAPRITVQMRDGTTCQDAFQGDELKWDLATETRRITALFGDLPWPREQLDGIVQAVSHVEDAAQITALVQLCIRR